MEISINIEELKKHKLFVATPMYGGMAAGMFTRSIADLSAICTQYGIPLQMYFLFNESLIPRARNYCCDEFMRSGADHMMFIDADIGFSAQDIIALMALQIQDSRYDIIGGPYPKKTISWEKIKTAVDKGAADKDPNNLEKFVGDFVFNPKNGQQAIPLGEPAEVLEIGTGFMMVTREAMQKFYDEYKDVYSYKPDHVRTEHFDGTREILQFFQAEIDKPNFEKIYRKVLDLIASGEEVSTEYIKEELNKADDLLKKATKRYLSEDYWFCQKAQAIGLRTWLCPWMKLNHVGTYIFGGSLQDLASIGASATCDVESLKKKKK